MATIPTVADFKAAFPEFKNAPEDLVQSRINFAVQRTDAERWGDLYAQGVMFRTADLMAKSPFGRPMQLVDKDGETDYSRDLKTMVRRVACGLRVARRQY
jgi:hypothetical protein